MELTFPFSPKDEALQQPDQEIERKENAQISDISLSGLSLGDFSLPSRSSYGTRGRPIVLRTNYLKMTTKPGAELYRYNVEIQPAIKNPSGGPNRRKIRRLIELLIASNDQLRNVATDYGKFIITATKLPLTNNTISLTQKFYEVEDSGPGPKSTAYKVKITADGRLEIQQLLNYLDGAAGSGGMTLEDKGKFLQALNIITTRTANENPHIYGGGNRNKFYTYPMDLDRPGASFKLGGGLVALKGFYTSVRTSTGRILVNINVANAAFYPAINLLGLMRLHTPDMANDGRSGLEGFISKLKVSHTYIKENGKNIKRVKTVQGFSRGPNPKYKHDFPLRGNARNILFECTELQATGKISVEKFFAQKWNVRLARPEEPCINLGSRETPVFVPPELLTVEPGQQFGKKLDEGQTRSMINFAVRRPHANARRIIEQGAPMMGLSPTNQNLVNFGVKVFPQMITVRGRILPTPSILYKQANRSKDLTPNFGAWNLAEHMFSVGGHLQDWTFLKFIDNAIGPREIEGFRSMLSQCGMKCNAPTPPSGVTAALNRGRGFEEHNDQIIEKNIRTAAEKKLKFLLVILPSKDAFIYSRVKFWAEVHYGIQTVCSVDMSFAEKGKDYAANVAHKVNLKLGGVNQMLPSDKLVNVLKDGKTMLVGMDVTHPSPGSLEDSPSIAGIVASSDGRYGHWPASMRAQESRKEMIDKLDEMFGERLDFWRSRNQNALPTRIVIYRDGISEGQYHTLLVDELPQIREACMKRYPGGRGPKISLIVCGKRHHTRFYPTSNPDRSGNPPNGTVVDRGITMEKGWDFYLQAHSAIQGTARPTHYVVLLEENGLRADDLEALTHNLCYLYGRATKAVSLCPPAYYADLLCERGRMYLYREFNARDNQTQTTEPKFDWNRAPWLRDVHKNVENTMFYI
ncbi:MAG: hypothetical protein Q9228_000792 [Teloschistes exilis]